MEYKLELDEVQNPQIEVDEPIKPITIELVDSAVEPLIIQAPRRSIRVRAKLEKYIF